MKVQSIIEPFNLVPWEIPINEWLINQINQLCTTIQMRKGQILESHEIFDLDLVWGNDKNVIKSSKILQGLNGFL